MKLMQLNVWMGRLTRQILPLIEQEKPDIITTQEMFNANGIVGLPDNTFHLLELMKKVGDYKYVYFSPIYEAPYVDVTVGCGNAILSRFPLVQKTTFFTNGAFQPCDKTAVFESNIRNAQVVCLELPDAKRLHVVNHHGYWEPNPLGSEKTVACMQRVADAIRELSGAVIFAGDLNINPGTAAMKLFDGMLEDLTSTYGISDTLSVLGKVPDVAPDHILVNSGIHVHGFRVLDNLVSDHKALTLDFDVR
ncbi:endonuclease/exonuclease/phosphatase family protein [Candidatus Saccharibacteria bacterium]|nr:MAG: endonuclease/exonuclease/phosphatase family protein [Candidatus Saccharibacteria bacterium]